MSCASVRARGMSLRAAQRLLVCVVRAHARTFEQKDRLRRELLDRGGEMSHPPIAAINNKGGGNLCASMK